MPGSIKPDRSISRIETTSDTLLDRGGLPFFNRYLFTCGILGMLADRFAFLRKSAKGLDLWRIFQQLLCFFYDGSSLHLTRFDELKQDAGYAAALETKPDKLASSHQIKRFFNTCGVCCWALFRLILLRLFYWRLQNDLPDVIVICIDTMSMDNDQAEKRDGCAPTYKKVKGFHPLHFIWNGFIVNALFRRGNANDNTGPQVIAELRRTVEGIRANYRRDVTIIVRMDAGFFDQNFFAACNELGIGFVATGKVYDFVKEQVEGQPVNMWNQYHHKKQTWDFVEFGYRCANWNTFYRAFYTVPRADDNGQILFDFSRPENVIVTNLGVNPNVLAHLSPEKKAQWLAPETIIACHHQRGGDELPHRALKDFGTEALPFAHFHPNAAFYYLMLIAFFLYEGFKRDVLDDVLPLTAYPTTVRRLAVDFAAKVTCEGHQFILKITQAVRDRLKIDLLWQRCQNPIPIRC